MAEFPSRGFTRRRLLAAGTAGVGAVLAWQVGGGGPARAGTGRSGPATAVVGFDGGWLFGPWVDGGAAPGFDDSGMATVTLPHTVVPLSWQSWDPATWERVWLYRKHFDAPDNADGMRIFLDFDGAVTGSTVTVNGHAMPEHLGGYLPFGAELTGLLEPTGNVVAVKLDATFTLDVPPDRPAPYDSTSVDFWQPGGIYRDVALRVVPQVFLADVFAKPVQVLDASARRVEVECTIDAATVPAGDVTVAVELRDGQHRIASTTVPATVSGTGQTTVTATLTGLAGVTLWDLDTPKLYDVVATLSVGGTAVHDYATRIGFREAVFQPDGFFLNGKRVKLFGLNRHQFFPFAGGAQPARVQRKDAEILRTDLNCNMVRCSHYPQSEAFLDACDELGLMVWEEAPGWGYLGDDAWKQLVVRDVGDMVRRDRNHPSVIIWGARLNETDDDTDLYTATQQVATQLDGSRPTVGAMAGRHDTTNYQQDVFSQNDYSTTTAPDGTTQPTLMSPRTDLPYMVSEAIGTLSGPAKYYRRTDTQQVQQSQATAHAQVHDIVAGNDAYCGLLAWSGYDYDSGSGNIYQGVKYTGVIDLFRVPKPGAALYQAHVDPAVRPVIQPAFYWDFGPTSPVNQLDRAMIWSNLDRLEVYVGGTHFATATPDTADFPHLPYPPSVVDFTGVDGGGHPELRIDGYLGSTKVASRSYSSDPAGDKLVASIDDQQLTGDGSDATRVVFRVVDRYRQPRPYVPGDVTFSVRGPAVLVGDNPFPLGDTGGTGAVWLRTLPNSPGTVTLTATHDTLGSATVSTRVTMPTPGGAPAPYGTLQAIPATVLATPGATATVTARFTNNGLPGLDTLAVSLAVPSGWHAEATTKTSFTGVGSGTQVTVAWQVTAPADVAPGAVGLDLSATYTAHGQRGVTTARAAVVVAYPSLAAAYNNAGTSDDSDVTAANFDGVGNSYSAQALAAAGLTPGGTVRQAGISFTWPDSAAGTPDNVVAAGQTVLVDGAGSALGFLGAGSPSDEGGTGTVHYTDGSTSPFTVVLDNYFYPPDTGNGIVATMPYLNDSNPNSNGGKAGRRNQTVYVYFASVPLTPGRTVRAVTLPAGGSIPDSGRITGMHVFAIGIG